MEKGPSWVVPWLLKKFPIFYGTQRYINPLKAKLNPICHLLALLRAHHILHVSRIRVNMFTTTHKLSLSTTRLIQSTPTHSVSLRSISTFPTLPPVPKCSKWSLSLRFPQKCPVCFYSNVPHTLIWSSN